MVYPDSNRKHNNKGRNTEHDQRVMQSEICTADKMTNAQESTSIRSLTNIFCLPIYPNISEGYEHEYEPGQSHTTQKFLSGLKIPRVQGPDHEMLIQNLYYNHYYPKPKYQILGYLDPLGDPVSKNIISLTARLERTTAKI